MKIRKKRERKMERVVIPLGAPIIVQEEKLVEIEHAPCTYCGAPAIKTALVPPECDSCLRVTRSLVFKLNSPRYTNPNVTGGLFIRIEKGPTPW